MKLENLGWSGRFQSLFEPFRDRGLDPGRITRVDRGSVTAEAADATVAAVVPGRLDPTGEPGPPAVGDWVALDRSSDTTVVRAILPRTGTLRRRRPGGPELDQAVAANVDVVLVVESVERGPNPRRIERAVALAWDAGATPVVVLTKIDLSDELDGAVESARSGAPFSDVVGVSAINEVGLDELERRLPSGSTAVLLGPSGVGKSTLTNRLLGEDRLSTRSVRRSDAKGRHTTTRRELVVLPSGACLVDTPGIRELGLWLGAEAASSAFPDIEDAAAGCRFRDCRHLGEPGCAVREAVAAGVIDAKRLDSFHRLVRESDRLEVRRHELRARERGFGKMVRQVKRLKEGRGS